jgi:hypothetical protein
LIFQSPYVIFILYLEILHAKALPLSASALFPSSEGRGLSACLKMVEVDHAALESPPPEPEPARPILASQLLDLEEKQRRRFCEKGSDGRVKTGCGEVDEVLGGGFERGVVVGLSAEGNEGRLVSDTSPLWKVLGVSHLDLCVWESEGMLGNAL